MTVWRQHVVSRTGNHLDPVAQPSSADVIFAAGFYEGEGSCHAFKTSAGVEVDVCQKDPEVLYRLRDLFGGSVVLHARKKGQETRWHRWALCGERARTFLKMIYPYLSSRRKTQIERTTAFRSVVTPTEFTRERLSMTKKQRRAETQRRYIAKKKAEQETQLIQ